MKRTHSILMGASLLLLTLGRPDASAFTHPCIPNSTQDLDYIKANLNQEPWKSGYARLLATWNPDYVPVAYASVSRSPNVNLGAWAGSMQTVYNYARLWYFTGNDAYAQKAREILLTWATTHTDMGGSEAGLALGDLALAYGGGASILRSWPGWSAADTVIVQDYFRNVFWPKIAASGNIQGPANKGSLNMMAGMAIALYCDDTAKFNHVLDLYRTYPGSGLPNTLATGEMGETGRDAGHAYGDLWGKVFIAECAWKQGIDLYSEWDNRLLAVGEYYSRNTYIFDNPFVHYGTVDYLYTVNASGPYGGDRAAFYLLQNAYKNRKGLPTPWIDRKLEQEWLNVNNFTFARTADFSTATPPAPVVRPAVSLASSGLTLTTLGTQTTGRSTSYANGVWTVSGLGSGVWTGAGGADDCQFSYQAMTGDCAIVGKATSFSSSGSQNGKAGLMIRDNLSATVSQRAWIGIAQDSSGTNLLETRVDGATEIWAGRIGRSTPVPSPGLPYWLKVERKGNTLTTYSSQDGTSWAPTVSCYFANLPSTLYVGLFVGSGNTTVTTATLANVAFTGGSGGLVTTPAAPAAVFAVGSAKVITVRWLPSFGATAYDVLRSTTSGSGYTAIASNLAADKTCYVDTTAAAGTTYYYVARAKNSVGASGNSPEFYGSLLSPAMVNLAFGGTSTASFNSDPGLEGSNQAFNSDAGSKWYGYNSPANWLQYDFGAGNAQVVKRYTISVADVATRDPKDWTFLCSQDGSTWTTLDTQSNQTFPNRRLNTYNLGNTTAYRYYRLNITANNGAGGVAVGDLGLWGDTGRIVPDGRYSIASRLSNKVIDLVNGSTADGTDAIQWSWNGGNDQRWNLVYLGNGQYKLTGVASGKLLEVTGASTANVAGVQIWPSNNNNCQKWTVTPAGDGFFKLLNVNSGKALDVKDLSTADGAAIIQYNYWAGNNQQWLMPIMP